MEVGAECGGDWAPDEQSVVDISLRTPLNATNSFKALVRDFQLDAVAISDGFSSLGKPKTSEKNVVRACWVKHVPLADVKPRWKLFTICESTF